MFSSISIGKIFDLYCSANTQNVILHIQKCSPCASSASCESYHTYVSMLFPGLVDFWSSFCVKPWTFRPSFHLLPPNFPLKPLQDVVFGPWNVQCWQPQSSNWLSLIAACFPLVSPEQPSNQPFFFVWDHVAAPPLLLMWKRHVYKNVVSCRHTINPLQGIASVVASLTRKWVVEVRLEEGNLGKKL